jgi:sarcosine oxidase delta subunit
MALVECPYCGKSVSNLVLHFPDCGKYVSVSRKDVSVESKPKVSVNSKDVSVNSKSISLTDSATGKTDETNKKRNYMREYMRRRRGGLRVVPVCGICGDVHHAKGMCKKHYMREYMRRRRAGDSQS